MWTVQVGHESRNLIRPEFDRREFIQASYRSKKGTHRCYCDVDRQMLLMSNRWKAPASAVVKTERLDSSVRRILRICIAEEHVVVSEDDIVVATGEDWTA